MNVILVGMNHKTAPLEIRERLSFSCGDGVRPLEEILSAPAVKEALYLSTCNRVEVLARAEDMEEAIARVKAFILRHGNLDAAELEKCLYVYCGSDAVRHLFRVTSSLDSMVMGEPQILGQMKEAYRDCVEQKASGIILNKLLHHAFRAAKRVRTETAIANNAVSVSFAAVEMAKKVLGSLDGRTVLLVGAGEMSELAARHLINNGAGKIIVANRTYARAVQVAEEFQGIPVGLDLLEEKLQEADIVISSTGAAGYMITPAMIQAALRRRKNRLLFLIDIAVPRDVDPEVGRIDNVYLFNIDDLQGVVDENLRNRLREAEKAEGIIGDEVLKFAEWYNTLEVVPTIVSLREKVESIMRAEMEKSGSWLKSLGEEDRKNIEILTTQIINKILHDPVTGLKEESQSNGAMPYVAAIRKLFRLGPEEPRAGRDRTKGERAIGRVLKVGTRGSQLALKQTGIVMEELRKRVSGLTLDVHIIKTTGDRMQDVSLAQIGGKGAFVKELEEALLERRIDLAIHSMKDVPALLPEGLVIAAMLEREDPRDVLISKGNFKLERIPPRARIGTGSLRRGSQLKNIYMDVEIVPIRGNLDTRIKKIERENLDGIIVAAAGLKRMGWQDRVSQYIPAEIMTPAVGQGALGVEVRKDDDVKEIVSVLNHETTFIEVSAERAFLAVFGAGCQVPVAAYGKIEKDSITVTGLVASLDGRMLIKDRVRGPVAEAEKMGRILGERILAAGGRQIIDEVYRRLSSATGLSRQSTDQDQKDGKCRLPAASNLYLSLKW